MGRHTQALGRGAALPPVPRPPPGPPQEGAQRPPETPGLSSFILLFPPWIIKIFFFFFLPYTLNCWKLRRTALNYYLLIYLKC